MPLLRQKNLGVKAAAIFPLWLVLYKKHPKLYLHTDVGSHLLASCSFSMVTLGQNHRSVT